MLSIPHLILIHTIYLWRDRKLILTPFHMQGKWDMLMFAGLPTELPGEIRIADPYCPLISASLQQATPLHKCLPLTWIREILPQMYKKDTGVPMLAFMNDVSSLFALTHATTLKDMCYTWDYANSFFSGPLTWKCNSPCLKWHILSVPHRYLF